MLNRIFILPPLAFARVGPSPHPCAAFLWGPSDTSPRGSGTTSLVPVETLEIAADGSIRSHTPDEILFRDQAGIRPVCPFFELHAEWTDDVSGAVNSGPVTAALLAQWSGSLDGVEWGVELANLKAFHYTQEAGDRIEAHVSVKANDHRRTAVSGYSPNGSGAPVIRKERPLPMGELQVAKPDADFPELRMRFYAPRGAIYGPEDLADRLKLDFDFKEGTAFPNAEWRGFNLPADRLIVNPQASWPRYVPDQATLGPYFGNDNRNTPEGLLAAPFTRIAAEGNPVLRRSLGLVDDVSDGLIRCRLRAGGTDFQATARLVVGPPDFAPANRPPVSLADNIADREDRAGPRDRKWTRAELGELVLDIFERALEASELMHRDYQNRRCARHNAGTLVQAGSTSPFDADDLPGMLWPVPAATQVKEGRVGAMALSEAGTTKHRRYATLEYLEDRFRENPALFDQFIRRPVDANPYWDRRMPALMRGSDGRPLHLTRRQWEIVRDWVNLLREEASVAGMRPPGA